MPLSVREVLLVLRAKDQASRVIADVGRSFGRVGEEADLFARRQIHAGQALLGVGVAATALGAAGVAFYGMMANEALEYNRQAALTQTQTALTATSLEEIKDIARDVGSRVAAPFEEMQTALYDIFSSTNANIPQARILLEQFSKDAVAGQVDIQSAARGTIGIMNAFQIPLENVTEVSDVMFRLVQKGVGTYEEFASTIGRAVPSTVRSGQSIEDLAGMLAFLTRNGLSSAMASSSAARALDSFSHPTVVARLEKMGIAVRDQDGNFRRIDDVVQDLSAHMGDLTDPQRAEFLQELFKGAGGTIQARRFWDIALKNPEALSGFVDDMDTASGAAQEAYDIIAVQGSAKLQLLKNNWKIFKTEIGDIVIPIFLKLISVGSKILQWFRGLDDETKKAIVYISLGVSAFLILSGILLGLAGVMLIVAGVAGLLNLSLLPFTAIVVGVIAVIALLAAGFYLLYQHSEEFRNFVDGIWQGLQRIKDAFDEGGWRGVVSMIWTVMKEEFNQGWQDFQVGWDKFLENLGRGWDEFPTALKEGLAKADTWLKEEGLPMLDEMGAKMFKAVFGWLDDSAEDVYRAMDDFGKAMAQWVVDRAVDLFNIGVSIGKQILGGVWSSIKDIPVLGDALGFAEDFVTSDFAWAGIPGGNPFDKGDEDTVSEDLVSRTAFAGAAIFGAPQGGYAEMTSYEVTGNNIYVEDWDDLMTQIQQNATLNNRAKGAAQPAAPKKAAPRPDAITGPR